MALKVGVKNKVAAKAAAEQKITPKSRVANKELVSLVREWKEAEDNADAYFPRIVQLVIELKTERKELKDILMKERGLTELSAGSELSVIYRLVELENAEELVEAVINGEDNPETGEPWTVRDYRKVGIKEQSGKDDPDTRLKKGLQRMANLAIEEAGVDDREQFGKLARNAFDKAESRIEKKQAKASKKAEADGEESEDQEGEEPEGDEEE